MHYGVYYSEVKLILCRFRDDMTPVVSTIYFLDPFSAL